MNLDGRIILALGGLFVIIGLGTFYMQQSEFENARSKTSESEKSLANERQDLVNTQREIEHAEIRGTQLQSAMQLALDQDQLAGEVTDLKKRRNALMEEFLGAVKTVRSREVGTELPEFTLKNGTTLKKVKITSISNTGLSLLHEMGITRVPETGLSDNYKARYRFDLDATVELALSESRPKVQDQDAAVAATTTISSPNSPIDTPPAPSESSGPTGPSNETLNQIAALTAKSKYYHQQIDQLKSQQSYYLQKAQTLTSRSASSSGTRTYSTYGYGYYTNNTTRIHSDPAQAARAEEQAKEYNNQIAAMVSQAAQIDAQLEALRQR